jgi:CubicO group peptidase (beta-lactamase class C family)
MKTIFPAIRIRRSAALAACLCLLTGAMSQPLGSPQIDSLVERCRRTFNVPGIAVGVVKDGKLIHARGYGVANLETGRKVDEHTLFGVASNSKAFTTAAISMLVDEGRMTWDDKVVDHIPGFRLYDPYVTEAFTVRDLVTHRSGLGLGAGDLMMWPDGSDFSRADIIHNLRYLKPVSAFRTKYDYDNLLYIVAGEVVAKVSGMPWEDFIEQRILKPLGFRNPAASLKRVRDRSNMIRPHVPVEGELKVVDIDWSETANAAGGIWSSISDFSRWTLLLLNGGRYGDSLGKRLFSDAMHREMWSPQTIIPANTRQPYLTHFAAYGLGWFLSDVRGYKQVTHTGGLAGIVTQHVLLPELGLGIIVFTNQQSGAAFSAISNTIKDGYLGVRGQDWVKTYADAERKGFAEADSVRRKVAAAIEAQKNKYKSGFDFSPYLGTYRDAWFGDIVLSVRDGKPWVASRRSPRLSGELLPYNAQTLVARWTDRSMDADAFLIFSVDRDGKPSGFRMEAISPLTDFSFDFQDLDLKRVD